MIQTVGIVFTQDYGLAAMCLARYAAAISQNGMVYSNINDTKKVGLLDGCTLSFGEQHNYLFMIIHLFEYELK